MQQDKAWSAPYMDEKNKSKTLEKKSTLLHPLCFMFVLTDGEMLLANTAPPDFYSPTALRVPLLSWSDREGPVDEQQLLNDKMKNKKANSPDMCLSTFSWQGNQAWIINVVL